MKHKLMMRAWMLAGLLAALILAACGPAQPRETVEATEPAESVASEGVTTAEADSPAPANTPVSREGAVTTDSGLQYVEVEAGEGAAPNAGDIVTMHFVGSLEDGTVFADSRSQGEPVTAVLGQEQLFPGWEEGILLMREGGQATLIIPPTLAFGEQGAGGVIPPNATVIMEVELISVAAPPEPTVVDEADYVTTDSGLKYYDIEEGEGDPAEAGQGVSIEFTIWLQDGNQYIVGSSENGQPLDFVLGSGQTVFPGWDEGVTSMKVGGKRQLIIPPELALGAQGGGPIPPDATLIIEVDLLEAREAAVQTEVDEADYITTESGLKYYDIVEGDGASPEAGQQVTVHYTGWLTDGTKFDSSVDRGQPFTFVLGTGGVIPGWDEGVATMKVGGKRQLVIPPELGYGEFGSGTVIPPGATLIFDVELLEVE